MCSFYDSTFNASVKRQTEALTIVNTASSLEDDIHFIRVGAYDVWEGVSANRGEHFTWRDGRDLEVLKFQVYPSSTRCVPLANLDVIHR